MHPVKITFYVERDEDDYELIVKGSAEPYVPPNFRGHPDNWSPAEGGDADVDEILIEVDGVLKRWTGVLTPEEEEEAREELLQALEDIEPDPDSGYDDFLFDEHADYVYDPF